MNTEYGYEKTLNFIKKLADKWSQSPVSKGRRLLIGDLSVKGGGPTPKMWGHPEKGFHLSHGDGMSFDVQILRNDNVERAREVKVTGNDPRYDHAATQDLVNLIHEVAGDDLRFILSADTSLIGTRREPGHVYHLHVSLQE